MSIVLFIIIQDDKRNETRMSRGNFPHHRSGIRHTAHCAASMLYHGELDSIAPSLDLPVLSPRTRQVAVQTQATGVTGTIQARPGHSVRRTRGASPRRQPRFV